MRQVLPGQHGRRYLPFSPLLIGERGATRQHGAAVDEVTDFQSPPHRGTWCDAEHCAHQREASHFQSPPHRGTWCDFGHSSCPRPRVFLSVPSSSGNVVRLEDRPLRAVLIDVPLSVPSSSGNVVRRGEPGLLDRPAPGAFSPLLIGERGATGGGAAHRGVVAFLSVPSSSGNVVRHRRSFRVHDYHHLSVPSSSGNVVRLVPLFGREHRAPPFSPLLIGERGATPCIAVVVHGGHLFQSPPHRGTWCDRSRGRRSPCGQRLSVPSSSGNVVRPSRTPSTTPRASRSFSPLLIGERGATLAALSAGNVAFAFQSPPHRGTWCDATGSIWLINEELAFSPLLIGERGATPGGPGVPRRPWRPLSVPSSSGNVVRRVHWGEYANQARLSVPSSSGNVVRPHRPAPA